MRGRQTASFWGTLVYILAGPILWAVQFTLIYAGHTAACLPGAPRSLAIPLVAVPTAVGQDAKKSAAGDKQKEIQALEKQTYQAHIDADRQVQQEVAGSAERDLAGPRPPSREHVLTARVRNLLCKRG